VVVFRGEHQKSIGFRNFFLQCVQIVRSGAFFVVELRALNKEEFEKKRLTNGSLNHEKRKKKKNKNEKSQ
jgi:hypothetical protein